MYSVTTEQVEHVFSEEPCFGALNNIDDRCEYEDDDSEITGIVWKFSGRNYIDKDRCIDYLMNRCRYTKDLNVNVTKRSGYTRVTINPDVTLPANKMMWQMCAWRDLVEKFSTRRTGQKFVDLVKLGCNETLAFILAEAAQSSDGYAKYAEECLYAPMTLEHITHLVLSDLSYYRPEWESYVDNRYYKEIKTYWVEGYDRREYSKTIKNFLANFETVDEALCFMKDYRDGELFNHRIGE